MKKWSLKKIVSFVFIFSFLTICFLPITVFSAPENVLKVEYNKYTIYYSDDYFRHPSTEYDPHLATASVIMTDNTVPRGNPKSDKDTEWYNNQPELLHGYFDAIGFTNFETNEDYRKRTEFDTIGVAAASRKVDDYTVVAITVRSGSYFHEWANNVWLGTGEKTDYMHEGWYNAANKLIDFLKYYVKSKNITGDIKLWITGFSRGGAVANIAAGLLDNDIDNEKILFTNGAYLAHDDLYAYTFEAPQGANYNSVDNKKPGDVIYNNIWNVVNPNDLVTKVAMSNWGFTRFGQDKYITTKFFDPENYSENRKTFYHFLSVSGKNKDYAGDYFDMYEIPGSKEVSAITNLISILYGNPTAIGSAIGEYSVDGVMEALDKSNWVVEDGKKENYDSNIVSTLILEEAVSTIGSRVDYTKNYQDHLKKLLYALMDDVSGSAESRKDEIIDCAIVSLVVGSVSDVYTLGSFGPNEIANLWAILSSNPAIKDMKDSIIPLIKLGTGIYSERPNELVSLAKNANRIFGNHEFAINIFHLESQDSYYVDEYNARIDADPGFEEYRIKLVPLRDSASFGRISYKDFNDTKVFFNDGNGIIKKVQIDGTKFGDSKVIQCDDGFAAGYYSYLTEEKLEVFVPEDHKYIINMQSFSKKPYHDVTMAAQFYMSWPNPYHQQKFLLKHFIDNVWFDSDFEQLGVDMRVYPKSGGFSMTNNLEPMETEYIDKRNDKKDNPPKEDTKTTVKSNTPIIKSSDSSLMDITLSNGNILFNKDILIYNIDVDNDVSKIVIEAKTSNSKATIEGVGEFDLNVGQNLVELMVTAEDGSTSTYSLNINRKEAEIIEPVKEIESSEETNNNQTDNENSDSKFNWLLIFIPSILIVLICTCYYIIKNKNKA